jgi:micrococcal nuclease
MYEYKAKILKIIDGDTVDFIVDLGFHVNIKVRGRFLHVNTPEKGSPDWRKATEECRSLLHSVAEIKGDEMWVIIKTQKTGKYGRWLVEIDGVTDRLAEVWPYGDK